MRRISRRNHSLRSGLSRMQLSSAIAVLARALHLHFSLLRHGDYRSGEFEDKPKSRIDEETALVWRECSTRTAAGWVGRHFVSMPTNPHATRPRSGLFSDGGRELSNSAVVVCRQACSVSKTLRFFSPCDGDVHAVRSGVPCMPLIFTTSGSLGKAKWDLCVFFSPLPCPFHWNLVSAGVCKASRALESIITSDLELSLFFSTGTGSKKAKWEVPRMEARGRRV